MKKAFVFVLLLLVVILSTHADRINYLGLGCLSVFNTYESALGDYTLSTHSIGLQIDGFVGGKLGIMMSVILATPLLAKESTGTSSPTQNELTNFDMKTAISMIFGPGYAMKLSNAGNLTLGAGLHIGSIMLMDNYTTSSFFDMVAGPGAMANIAYYFNDNMNVFGSLAGAFDFVKIMGDHRFKYGLSVNAALGVGFAY